MKGTLSLSELITEEIPTPPAHRIEGRVQSVRGPIVRALIPQASLGDLCHIVRRGSPPLPAQIIGFEGELISLAPTGSLEGVSAGAPVTNTQRGLSMNISPVVPGSIVDALGVPLQPHPIDQAPYPIPIFQRAPAALTRAPIRTQLTTGVAAIDGLLPLGYGQRMGLFAGAGLGKSSLIGTIARNAEIDLCVVALVGERGREVNEFLDDCLGAAGLARSIVVVSTSDESPLRRALGPLTATSIAEYYREKGLRVLLLVDSLTRYARALREVTLSAGELPVRQGYTPSVYTQLPALLERSGNNDRGSITALYTVLTEGNGELDPLGEEIKSILDGHIVLSPVRLADGVRPAIDIPLSISRLTSRITEARYQDVIHTVTTILARVRKDRDILQLGGTPDRELKASLEVFSSLSSVLNQPAGSFKNCIDVRAELTTIAARYKELVSQR